MSDLEQKIAAVWRELLHLTDIGAHDNFFDLGANSLLMMQASARLSAALGQKISLIELFRHPTISALAANMRSPAPDSRTLEASLDRARGRAAALRQLRQDAR